MHASIYASIHPYPFVISNRCRRDEKLACKMFVQLSLDEPGENLLNPSWRYTRMDAPIGGKIIILVLVVSVVVLEVLDL